jgi:hypothetical protein
VANANGQIQTFSRRMLDPRRPKRKVTAEEAGEEWLVSYEPVVPNDPHRIISHKYPVRPSLSQSLYTWAGLLTEVLCRYSASTRSQPHLPYSKAP